jgi:hypothetical protein
MTEFSYTSVTVDIVEGGLSEVPYVGHILSDLVPSLWPAADNSVWWEVEKQVEALFDEEISEEVYNTVNQILTGLSGTMANWNDAVATNDLAYIQENWPRSETSSPRICRNFRLLTTRSSSCRCSRRRSTCIWLCFATEPSAQ